MSKHKYNAKDIIEHLNIVARAKNDLKFLNYKKFTESDLFFITEMIFCINIW